MDKRWKKFTSLKPDERFVFVAACALLPLIWLALRLLGFSRSRKLLSLTASGGRAEARVGEGRRLARLVNAAAGNGVRRANCLERSLLLWWMLRHGGIASDIRFGASKGMGESGRFNAHAWVEWKGEVLNDRADIASEFAPFSEALEAAGATAHLTALSLEARGHHVR